MCIFFNSVVWLYRKFIFQLNGYGSPVPFPFIAPSDSHSAPRPQSTDPQSTGKSSC